MTREELLKMLKICYLWLNNPFDTLQMPQNKEEFVHLNKFKNDLKTVLVYEGMIDQDELN